MDVNPYYRYFVGRWSLRRTFEYQLGGTTGRMVGSASFLPWFGTTLLYEERGTLSLNDGQRLDTFRRYAYVCDEWEVALHFVSGRYPPTLKPFCTLRFGLSKTACTEHACRKDRYCGRFELMSPSIYHTSWRVCGPTKQGTIETSYTHQCADLRE